MKNWGVMVCMAVLLAAGVAGAETRLGRGQPLSGGVAAVEPAAGEPSLLDERADALKFGAEAAEADEGTSVSAIPALLKPAEAAATRAALREARAGKAPNLAKVPAFLHGQVQAAYLLGSARVGPAQLNRWLETYPNLAQAGKVYELAESRRARPHQACKTKIVKEKKPITKGKNKGKTKTVSRKVKSCTMVGSWGPAPAKPASMLAREERREAAEEARQERLNGLSAEGRRLVGQSWRQRGRGDYAGAVSTLLASGSRFAMGGALWQSELVKVADYYHGQRNWPQLKRVAEAAAAAKGPDRDEALWLAGFANYRLGNMGKAASLWEELVKTEPATGKHHPRAAWWAAQVLEAQGETSRARQLLAHGAGEGGGFTFYGQLCAAKLGQSARTAFSVPPLSEGGVSALLNHAQTRQGIALAQIGETTLAEAELRAARSNLPYHATAALAAVGVKLNLPATALAAGKDLAEQGKTLPAALYPLPLWKPTGGWGFDRAFILAIMRQESAFQPEIGSRVGAQGLMQFMPATASYIARLSGKSYAGRKDLHDPAYNIALAQDYLNYLSGKLDGNLLHVAAAYNGGIGNVQRWLARGITSAEDPILWLESIPFDETRDYVEKVFANYWVYQQRLGQRAWSLDALTRGTWPNKFTAARAGAEG